MTKIKNIVFLLVCVIVIVVIGMNYQEIIDKFERFFTNERVPVVMESNGYDRKYNYLLINQVDDYIPENYDDLVNIYYSILNQGWDKFTFYCSPDYDSCLDDVATLSNNNDLLSSINDFISPYNSYSTIKTAYDETGEITVKVQHVYNSNEITQIDSDIDKIIAEQTNEQMSDRDKIQALHDYIINNTKYDSKKANDEDSPYDSARIQGVLYDHYAICSGYTDIMAIMLDKMGIPNFKVSSSNHVWNAVYLDGKWYHLDLTWDDPVTTTGKDLLEHNYFLISTEELHKQDKENNTSSDDENNHNFNQNIYLEFKTN